MDEFDPDPTLISSNPFAFKEVSQEATDALDNYLRRVARFFRDEITSPEDLYKAWNRYQNARGGPAVVAVGSSVTYVMGVRQELDAIAECDKRHYMGGFGKILVLLHIGLIEMVEGAGHVNFAVWAAKKTEGDAPTLPASVSPEDVCRYLESLRVEYEENHGTARHLATALMEGLSVGEQAHLLMGYRFTRRYRLGESVDLRELEHLHCRARREKRGIGKSAINCHSRCHPPNAEEVKLYLPRLAKQYLYKMRNQLVHRASAVFITNDDHTSMPENSMPAISSSSMLDAFFVDDEHLISYEVTLGTLELTAILRRCVWNRFRAVKL